MNLIIEKVYEDAKLPYKEHARSSGFDLYIHRFVKVYVENYQNHEEDFGEDISDKYLNIFTLESGCRVMIDTGIKACVDYSNTSMATFCAQYGLTWELQIRSRSGTALKRGLVVSNSPATVDQGYTGIIYVMITNTSKWRKELQVGERIAQLVPALVALPTIVEGKVSKTDTRGEGGFNSTGKF